MPPFGRHAGLVEGVKFQRILDCQRLGAFWGMNCILSTSNDGESMYHLSIGCSGPFTPSEMKYSIPSSPITDLNAQ